MDIRLTAAGKRYNRDWIFRNVDFTFTSGSAYAIVGNNGSGKSTLLQCIAGAVQLNAGDCVWELDNGQKESARMGENIHRQLSLAAPYLDVIEEMTAAEFLRFHHSFKPLLDSVSIAEMLSEIKLDNVQKKQIRFFSSGMKQRVKLAQAIFSQTPVLLLDEPCSNLDKSGYDLYHHLIAKYAADRLVIVSSNDPLEYGFCGEVLDIRDFKP